MSAFNQPYIPPPSCFSFCNNSDEVEESRAYTSFLNHPPDRSADHCLDGEERAKKQEVDNLLAEGMGALTFEERQRNQEILHGVAVPPKEDENVLNRALEELDLRLLLTKQGSMYEVAEQMDPEYVQARRFRVMFLRANQYDGKASADQMLRFFESKSQLFGCEKLVKDITIDDLDEDDIACLKSGALQIIGTDTSGRQVLLYVGALFGGSAKNLQKDLRVQFFIVMTAFQSEETQLRGTVSIVYAMGNYRSKTIGGGYLESFRASRARPEKIAAIHLCLDVMQEDVVLGTAIKILKGSMSARIKLHYGSRIECQYHLSTYGIPSQLLPIDENGKLNLDRHLQWVDSLTTDATVGRSKSLKLEDEIANAYIPGIQDVLFTGAKVSYTEGNQRYLVLIHEYSQDYASAGSTRAKRQVVDVIINKIHESGGRFLKPQSPGIKSSAVWVEVQLDDLRKRVSQAIRNRLRRTNTSNTGSK